MKLKIKITEENIGYVELLRDILEAENKYGFSTLTNQELLQLLKDELEDFRLDE